MSQTKPGSARPSTSNVASTAAPSNVQEFTVRLPKNTKKVHHVMRFNATLSVDFAKWKNVKMERENNLREMKNALDEEMPKFGAGSEYNRDQKEELRRKKYGVSARKYKPDAQPWILKVGGKTGKKFRGVREGGVSDFASFYVFAHAPDGCIEAYPLNEWYNFQPIQRYKALSAEEAEEEFGRRNKVLNYFSLMMRNRLKGDDEGQEDPEEAKLKGAGKKGKEFKISDADEVLMNSSDDDSDESDSEEKKRNKDDDSDDDKKKQKGKKQAEKKKKKASDDEAFEESDDGDEEGREMDYISDSSEPESDPESKANKEMKSVAEEDGLRKWLTSDESSDEEKKSSDESNKEEEKNKKEVKESNGKDKKKKKLSKKLPKDGEKKESLSDFSSDSSDSEVEKAKPKKLNGNSASNSRSASPSLLDGNSSSATGSGIKRKIQSMPSDLGSENSNSPNAKKSKIDSTPIPSSFAGVISSNKDDNGISEEAVRRYLLRKPMTTTELLTKFKNKKTGVSSEKLVETMTQILKKINPHKQTIQGKMYLSIKNK